MGQDLKGDHLELMKEIDEDMEDFVIEVFAQADTKMGEGSLTGQMIHGDSGIAAIGSSPVFIPEQQEELRHLLIAVDIAKEIEEEEAWGIVARGTPDRISMGH